MDTLSKVSEYLNNLEAFLDDGHLLEARKVKVEKSEKELEMFEALEHKSVVVKSKNHRVVVFTKAPPRAFSKPFMRFYTPYGVDGQGDWDTELDMADSHNYMMEEMFDKLGFIRVDYGDYGRKMVKEVHVEIYGDFLVTTKSKVDFGVGEMRIDLTMLEEERDIEALIAVITEYLVNISKRRAFWSLNEDILKINYSDNQYAVSIKEDTAVDDPNITMEEYVRLEEEKARKRGKVFNWETSKILFDDSDDEDYTVDFDKNLFSYKIISTNDLKMDSKNDNEKVNMPSLPSPEPVVSCFDDLEFFKDFENKFSAIVYNDAPTSKSDLLTEPILSPQHIDEYYLNDETSLSEYDEEEQNLLYFNDLFPFNIIHPDDLKVKKDNDDNQIDIIQSSEDMALPPHYQRHQYLRYEGLQYSDADIMDFKARLARIYMREVQRVEVINFKGLPDLMAEGLSARMLMEHRDAQGIGISSAGDFIGTNPSYTAIRDPILRGIDIGSVNVPYLLARYLRLFATGRKNGALISRGQFVARLAEHFGLLAEERLRGLTVIAPKLPIIDMVELVRLQICMEIDDTWAWVAMGPKRQPDAAAGALGVAQDAPAVDEGVQAIPAPVQIHGALAEQREVIGVMARDFSRFTIWAASEIAQLLDYARVTYTSYSETRIPYQRCVKRRTDGTSTSIAQQDHQQPDL
ncbi:hypothetical protein Tco_0242249 [Tanacetum coccineum]